MNNERWKEMKEGGVKKREERRERKKKERIND